MGQERNPDIHEIARILRLANDREFHLNRAAELERATREIRERLDPITRRTLDRLILTDSEQMGRRQSASIKKSISRN